MAKISSRKARVGIIIIAAILVELISIVQYSRFRNMMEKDLSIRSRIVIGSLADKISHRLELTETAMLENLWDVRRSLENPDSTFNAIRRLIDDNPTIIGGCLAFVPDYYPSKGRLFEPYISKENGTFVAEQLAGPNHDYTRNKTFIKVLESQRPVWSDPYTFGTDSIKSLTTYSYPIKDSYGKIAAVCGLDMDLSWLGDTLNATQPYKSSFGLMLTREGEFVAGPSGDRLNKEDLEQVVSVLNGSKEPIEKKARIIAGSMKKAPFWQVANVYYKNEVYKPLHKMRLQQMFLILLGLLILFFITERYAHNEKKLNQATAEQARISSELAVARNIQMQMLPTSFPKDIYGSLVPAREVGGDLFDFFIRKGKLVFCIGDVSGKGVPSAMVMSVTHSLFRMVSATEDSPARILTALNTEGCRDNESNMFVTFFLGVLDLQSGVLCYANAGHDRPMLITDSVTALPVKPNLPLGIFPDTVFEEQSCTLEPGTTIFLYTDGLTEAKKLDRQPFGKERLVEVLKANHNSPQEMVNAMNDAAHQFTAGAPQSDDLTMLAIRYPGKVTVSESLTLQNNIKDVAKLGDFVKAFNSRLPIDSKLSSNLRLALEEIVVNVIQHAYPEGEKGQVDVEVSYDGNDVTYTVKDSGKPFDPTAIPDSDTSQDARDRPIGGLGILLARKITDNLTYRREERKNVLSLQKSIS